MSWAEEGGNENENNKKIVRCQGREDEENLKKASIEERKHSNERETSSKIRILI